MTAKQLLEQHARRLFQQHRENCVKCYEQYKINEMCDEGHKLFDNYYDEVRGDYEQDKS